MADSGQVLLDGEPINFNHPSQIGYMPEERGLYKKMKVGEQLLYLAQLKGMPYKEAKQKLHSWLDKFDIISWWDKRVEELSKGMQQKIQFIATVVHEPKLLILDEPFSGLDPINTNLIKDEIDQLNQNGTSIIFSTHRMEQVEEVCENIILINNGRKILEGNVSQIKIDHKENLFKVEFDNSLLRINGLANFQILERPNDLLGLLIGNGAEINSFNEILPSINDIFISRVGKSKE